MRTNVVIDDELMRQALRASGLPTKCCKGFATKSKRSERSRPC